MRASQAPDQYAVELSSERDMEIDHFRVTTWRIVDPRDTWGVQQTLERLRQPQINSLLSPFPAAIIVLVGLTSRRTVGLGRFADYRRQSLRKIADSMNRL